MRYWKGLMIAAAVDLAWIAGHPSPVGPRVEVASAVVDLPADPAAASRELDQLTEVGRVTDSLMSYLQDNPEDVTAMEAIARVYADNGWWDAAINPLARALQLDPARRSLWVLLDRAVEKSGRDKITDAELVRRAAAFTESVEMMGHGC